MYHINMVITDIATNIDKKPLLTALAECFLKENW